jgi:hypothetical protein
MSLTESQSSTNGGGDSSDGDEVWNELAAARVDAPSDEDAATTTEAPVDAEPTEPPQAGSDKEAAPNTDAAPKGPAAEASDDDAFWEGVSPDARARLQARFEQQEQTVRSVKGRVSVLDRQLEQFRRGAGQPQRDEGGSGGNQGATGGRRSIKSLLETDEMKLAREEYGQVIDPLVGIIGQMADDLESMSGTAEQVEQERFERFVLEQQSTLERAHPDWLEVCGDERFGPWLDNQPEALRAAFQKNEKLIVDAADAKLVIDVFKAAHGAAPGQQTQQQTSGDSRRDRQRAGAPRAAGSTTAATAVDPEDPDALWDTLARTRERQRLQR